MSELRILVHNASCNISYLLALFLVLPPLYKYCHPLLVEKLRNRFPVSGSISTYRKELAARSLRLLLTGSVLHGVLRCPRRPVLLSGYQLLVGLRIMNVDIRSDKGSLNTYPQ